MSQADEVRALFAGNEFGDPCSEADIECAEAALGEPLPATLRELYLAFNGFVGPGNSEYFWPLFGDDNSLVRSNKFYRELIEEGVLVFSQELHSRS